MPPTAANVLHRLVLRGPSIVSISEGCLCLPSGAATSTNSWMEPVEWAEEKRLSECSRSSEEESEVVVTRLAYPRYSDSEVSTHDSFAPTEKIVALQPAGRGALDALLERPTRPILGAPPHPPLEDTMPSDDEAGLRHPSMGFSCAGTTLRAEDDCERPRVLMIPCAQASGGRCCSPPVATPYIFEWQAATMDEEVVSTVSDEYEVTTDVVVDSPRAESVVHVEPFSLGNPVPPVAPKGAAISGISAVNEQRLALLERYPVTLHVYDISYMSRMAGVPFFHFGVEVHDKEYAFGERGIGCTRPARNPRHIHREAVCVGFTTMTKEQVSLLRKHLKKDWQGCSYSPLIKNCQSFAAFFCGALGVAKGPDCIPERFCKLPEPTSAVAQASDALFGIYTAMPKCDVKQRLNRFRCGVISNCKHPTGNTLADEGSSKKKKKSKNADKETEEPSAVLVTTWA